jgi:AraC-like DNA-binding protein
MRDPHQHTEIEFNWVARGAMTYRFGARDLHVRVGEWTLFWGATPHTLSHVDVDAECVWVTLPLADFLRLALPDHLTHFVLHGEPVRVSDTEDQALFERWAQDWCAPHADSARILRLELEARLLRLAHTLPGDTRVAKPSKNPDHAARLAQYMTEHHSDPITAADVASAAGLNANYAAGVFKRSFGMTLTEYLTQHRLARAQRLLAITNQGVLEIAMNSGFGSSSRFYAVFARATGRTPLEFRRDAQGR